jgi:hypothetical protein
MEYRRVRAGFERKHPIQNRGTVLHGFVPQRIWNDWRFVSHVSSGRQDLFLRFLKRDIAGFMLVVKGMRIFL